MAQRRKQAKTRPETQAPPNGLLTLPVLVQVLGVSLRQLHRYKAAGVITPAVVGAGRSPALWDGLAVAKAIIAERTGAGARERRDDAQARLLELRIARERRDLLDRGVIDRAAAMILQTARGRLLRLPGELTRAGLAPATGEARVTEAVYEVLRELARLERITEDAA